MNACFHVNMYMGISSAQLIFFEGMNKTGLNVPLEQCCACVVFTVFFMLVEHIIVVRQISIKISI